MSTVMTVSPDVLGPIASAVVAAVATWWVTRYQRHAVAEDKALIARFLGGNDSWLDEHKQRFARAYTEMAGDYPAIEAATHVTGEVLSVAHVDDDRDAPDDDTDRTGWWRVLLALVWDLAERVHDAVEDWQRSWRERDQVGSGGVREVLAASGYELDGPPVPPYRGRHWVSDVQHTGQFPAVVPAQRKASE